MAKLTAVIDIGSNSARLVIFQKTSRYGFHLLCQYKNRVRIGEGAYQKDGYLQPVPMQRAFDTLQAFKQIIDEYKVHKTLCVATSALRDAPNRSKFIKKVKNKLKLDIRVIGGELEARYGAIAASNLLPIKEAVTIDIGGGSSDMARVVDGKIVETFSLDIGTVRLKELFTQGKLDTKKAGKLISKELSKLPDSFRSKNAVGIGGTARALAKGIMVRDNYPLDKIHAFRYELGGVEEYFDQIVHEQIDGLERLHIKPERYDTIREGASILLSILNHIGAIAVYSSGVGVREGVYLHDRLRKYNDRFPVGINPSIQSIKDRFDLVHLPSGNKYKIARKLISLIGKNFGATEYDEKMIMQALSLSDIGKMLTIYKEHQHAFYISMQELNYGFTHQEMMTIAVILRSKGKKYHKALYKEYEGLLPHKNTLQWLIFIYSLTLILHENSAKVKIDFSCKKDTLYLRKGTTPYLAIAEIRQLSVPKTIKMEVR
jgi:exopolyphosphatase/guanosine-5'-triphosphate,3'-diphosphate pyrophosphatase